MLFTIDPVSKTAGMLSIPRDLWIPDLAAKINTAYSYGQERNDQGKLLAKTAVSQVTGKQIDYVLVVDFDAFINLVDHLGGIDVNVRRTLDDYKYPILGKENDLCGLEEKEMDFNEEEAKKLNIDPGKRKVLISSDGSIATDSAEEDKGIKYFSCRYEHINFEKGQIHMNGKVALSFVRSRHGTNGEGSDFARSKRQQKVIEAIKSKILSLETLANPQRVSDLVKTFGRSIDTDISVKDTLEFYKLSRQISRIQSFVLDDSKKVGLPDGRTSLFINPPRDEYGGAYVLISEDDDFSIVAGYVRKILKGEITEYDATSAARPR